MILQNTYLLGQGTVHHLKRNKLLGLELKECKKLKEVIYKCQLDLLSVSRYMYQQCNLHMIKTYLVVELKECKKMKEVISRC